MSDIRNKIERGNFAMYDQETLFEEICESKIERVKKLIGGRRVYIWGAGKGGRVVESVCRKHDVMISGFCDKCADKIKNYLGYPVYALNKMSPDQDFLILSFMGFYYDVFSWIREIGYTCKDCFYMYENEGYNKEDIVYRGCKVGRYTYGYESLLNYCPLASEIGRFCSINSTAHIWSNHAMGCVTTHPLLDYPRFYAWDNYEQRDIFVKKYGKYKENADFENSDIRNNPRVIIGNDVWIGANVSILPGVVIGDGAVIAAGAVVNKSIDAYAIAGGVPAKVINYRFSPEDIQIFEEIRWWDWPIETIEEHIELFYQPHKFLAHMREMTENCYGV